MRPEDVVSVGDEITVMVTEVDQQGRVNLSRRAALSGEMPSAADLENERAGRGPGRGGMGGRGGGGYGRGPPREKTPPRPGDNRRGGGYRRGGRAGVRRGGRERAARACGPVPRGARGRFFRLAPRT